MLRRILIFVLVALVGSVLSFEKQPKQHIDVFVDTDAGITDAFGLALLLADPTINIVGVTTVAGDTTVENVTRNVLTVFDQAGRHDIPVTIGAAVPIQLPLTRTGAFTHGPDGLWGVQRPHDISGLPHDAPAAIAAAARQHPGLNILAIGPMTNIAQTIQRFPGALDGVRIIAVDGGRRGNHTAVAEFNAFADPHALQIVLGSHLNITLITVDAFEQLHVDGTKFVQMMKRGNDLQRFLADPLEHFFQVGIPANLHDAALPAAATAVMYLRNPALATTTPALVKVVTDDGIARGQTIIATDIGQKIQLIARDDEVSALVDRVFSDPSFDFNAAVATILAREPDNASIVLEVDEQAMEREIVAMFRNGRRS